MIRTFDAEGARKVLRYQTRFTGPAALFASVLVVMGLVFLVVGIALSGDGAGLSATGGLALLVGALLAFLSYRSSRGVR